MNTKIQKIIATTLSVFFVFTGVADAFSIMNNASAPSQGSFVVGPAKSEVSVSPGETKNVEIRIQNRMGRTQNFEISFEDFVASKNVDQTVELVSSSQSQTSLEKFMSVEKKNFTLEQGDELRLPVTIRVPDTVEPGGRFGAVIVSAVSQKENIGTKERVYSGATVVSRIASLMFVKVNGEVVTSGTLKDFSTKNNQSVFWSAEVPVRIAFENTGNVHINPYGLITVKDVFGSSVGEVVIDPWFVLPGSVRTRDVSLYKSGLLGRYTASLEMNPGYGSTTQVKKIVFYVVSPSAVLITISISLMVLFGVRQFVKKKKNDPLV